MPRTFSALMPFAQIVSHFSKWSLKALSHGGSIKVEMSTQRTNTHSERIGTLSSSSSAASRTRPSCNVKKLNEMKWCQFQFSFTTNLRRIFASLAKKATRRGGKHRVRIKVFPLAQHRRCHDLFLRFASFVFPSPRHIKYRETIWLPFSPTQKFSLYPPHNRFENPITSIFAFSLSLDSNFPSEFDKESPFPTPPRHLAVVAGDKMEMKMLHSSFVLYLHQRFNDATFPFQYAFLVFH